jgi:hypothetical protein
MTKRTDDKPQTGLGRLRWVIGTPYFGEGTSTLTEIPILYFMFEGVVGAGLYDLFQSHALSGPIAAFAASPLNIAATEDERTLILQIFVYISLFFTLLTIPFVELLRRELARRGIVIRLGRRE